MDNRTSKDSPNMANNSSKSPERPRLRAFADVPNPFLRLRRQAAPADSLEEQPTTSASSNPESNTATQGQEQADPPYPVIPNLPVRDTSSGSNCSQIEKSQEGTTSSIKAIKEGQAVLYHVHPPPTGKGFSEEEKKFLRELQERSHKRWPDLF